MSLEYISTRGAKEKISASRAIVEGLAGDEGLYVPENIPVLDISLEKMMKLPYKEMAYEILKLYLTDFTKEELLYCIENAYDEKFDTPLIAPLKTVSEYNFLELYHGKTLAFKDMALSILPYLMKVSAKKQGIDKKIVILTATSGDTGKAALEGFANVKGIDIIVFYPCDGVSDVQKLQMTTQQGENTKVIGIRGNFDEAQTGVKNIFTDTEFNEKLYKENCILSSANSINIGRLVPQIVYYFYAYAQLVNSGQIKAGEKINFTVPTGNFGNILAGYYAKNMGLPIDKLICASNSNKVLYDYFDSGIYNKNRAFVLTSSPSMDILISSNFERYIYNIYKDTAKVKSFMKDLKAKGEYSTLDAKDESIILGEYADEEEVFSAIKKMHELGYVMDTHTAVAFRAYEKYLDKNPSDTNKNVIVSTASPYKFADSVIKAIIGKVSSTDVSDLLSQLSQISKTDIPLQIDGLDKKEIKHKEICEKEEMKDCVAKFVAR